MCLRRSHRGRVCHTGLRAARSSPCPQTARGRVVAEPVLAGVHYDLWTGSSSLKPFTRNRFHYNWHWIWEPGNGDLDNQGVHQVDVAR